MTAYFVRRLLLVVPTLIGVTVIAFTITRFVPGGPFERAIMQMRQGGAGGESGSSASSLADTGVELSPEAERRLKEHFDLDKPGYIAYFFWLKKTATLDFGESYRFRTPVTELIFERLPISLTFGLCGFVLAYLISIPLGILKALRHGTAFDFGTSAIVFIGYSIPGWAFGAVLLMFLASGKFAAVLPLGDIKTSTYQDLPKLVKSIDDEENVVDEWGMFNWERLSPTSKLIDRIHHMLLPVFCYMMGSFAALTILTKNSLMENLSQDYVRTAFAKGLSPKRVILVHALRNSLIPLATGLGHAIGVVMAGSYLIEMVFNIDGIGYLGFTSLQQRDYTVVMGILTINTILVLLGNILSDVLYAIIDPRIRFD